MPITLLNEGQEIEMTASIKMGKGQEHAKFSPGMMNYRQISEIYVDKEIAEKMKNTFPNIETKSKGDKILIIDDKEKEIADICEGFAERYNKKIEVKPTEEVVISLESFGQIDAKSIFAKAVEALKKDLDVIAKKLSK
jgi:DNA-directed RNA polymerase subunit D